MRPNVTAIIRVFLIISLPMGLFLSTNSLSYGATANKQLVYYTPEISPEEAQDIASRYDQILISLVNPSQAAQLKSYNPNLEIFGYQFLVGITRSSSYRAEANNHPNWFVRDQFGNEMRDNTWGWTPMDLSQSGWRQFLINQTTKILAENPAIDGIFSDDSNFNISRTRFHSVIVNEQGTVGPNNTVSTQFKLFGGGRFVDNDIEVYTNPNKSGTNYYGNGSFHSANRTIQLENALPVGTPVYVSYRAYDTTQLFPTQQIQDQWQDGITQLFIEMKSAIAPKIIIANTGNRWSMQKVTDGIMNESFGKISSLETWRDAIESLSYAMKTGKTYMATRLEPNPSLAPRVSRFSFFSYLLGMGETGTFYFREQQNYASPYFDPLWDIDLGNPIGDYQFFVANNNHPDQNENINLVTNGSFEDGLAGWNENIKDEFSHLIDLTVGHDGNRSLKFEVTDGLGWGSLYQNITLEPNTIYTASAWMKRTGMADNEYPQIVMSVTDLQTEKIGASARTFNESGDWVLAPVTFKTGLSPDLVQFHGANFPQISQGTVWFDDIRVEKGVGVYYRQFEKGMVFVNPNAEIAHLEFPEPMIDQNGVLIYQLELHPESGEVLFYQSAAPPAADPLTEEDQTLHVYPFVNPFIPTQGKSLDMTFRFNPQQPISIEILTRDGQKIKDLESGQTQANMGQTSWDGRNQTGQLVATGIYLIVFKNDSQEVVKKSAILR